MEKESLLTTIDKLAVSCCKLMTDEERTSFFNYRKERSKVATYTSPKYFKTEYIRGENKGKAKNVWNINGQIFNILWSNILLYVTKSVKHSYEFNREDVADDVEEIKLLLFKTLRFFGPKPCNMPLSQFLHILINNYLTNTYNDKRRRLSSKRDLQYFEIKKRYKKLLKLGIDKDDCVYMLEEEYHGYSQYDILNILAAPHVSYKEVSISEHVVDFSSKYNKDNVAIIDTLTNNSYEELLFFVEIPDELVEASELLIGGMSMIQTAEQVGIYRRKLKDKCADFLK